MKAEDISRFEKMHADIQQQADTALAAAVLCIQMARDAAKAYKTEQPEMALLSEDLQQTMATYVKIGEMEFKQPFHQSKPAMVRKAMELLEIIP